MELPIHRDREFGLRLFRNKCRYMMLLLFALCCILTFIFASAIRVRYAIVYNRIGPPIENTAPVYAVFNEVKHFLRLRDMEVKESPEQLHWFCLKQEESFRGGLMIAMKKKNPFGLREGAVIIALSPQMVDSKSTWYYQVRERREEVMSCTLFLAILHELVHHITGSHDEALSLEEDLLKSPPGLTGGCEVTQKD